MPMIIHVKNKSTLIIGSFIFKCCIGKNGFKDNKKEGDYSTPKGLFKIRKLYFRKDRVSPTKSKIKKKIITTNIGWCDNPANKKYNEEIELFNKEGKERFYRIDNKYDYLITISHNEKKVPHLGSAIFLHLTNNYKPTAGCIALKKKDFEVMLKLINQDTKIKIG